MEGGKIKCFYSSIYITPLRVWKEGCKGVVLWHVGLLTAKKISITSIPMSPLSVYCNTAKFSGMDI
jgi:hypothetical protein